MARYKIIRKQMTPSGVDQIVKVINASPETLRVILQNYAVDEAAKRNDVDHVSVNDNPMRATLIGQPAGTGNKYSRHASMVEYVAAPDLDEPIPLSDAVAALVDMINFGGKNGSDLAVDDITMTDGVITLVLARECNYTKGVRRRFKITVEPL